MPDDRAAKIIRILNSAVSQRNVQTKFISDQLRTLGAPATLDRRGWPPWPRNKAEKDIATSFGGAFAKLEDRLSKLDKRRHEDAASERAVLERAVYGSVEDFFTWKAQLRTWRQRLETFGGKTHPVNGGLFPADTSAWPLGKPKPSSAKFEFKHLAVAAAARILERHNIPLTVTRISQTREGSVFTRVATILAYGESVDHQCREFKKARNRASE